jgi:hypothetical protein
VSGAGTQADLLIHVRKVQTLHEALQEGSVLAYLRQEWVWPSLPGRAAYDEIWQLPYRLLNPI